MFDKLRNNSRIIVYIVVAAFVISGGFMGYGAYMNNDSDSSGNRATEAIAKVNGEKISYQEYLNAMRNQAQKTSQLSSTQLLTFRLNILNSIIERRLILQEAEKMGINPQVTEEDIDNSINEILDNNNMTEEELKTNLEEQDYTMSDLRNDLRMSLQSQKTIEKTIEKSYEDAEVSESEIKKEYDKQSKNNEEIADFSEKRDEIKENLLQKKQSESYNTWMEGLQASANIEIYDNSLKGVKALNNEEYETAIDSFEKALEESESPTNYIYLAKSYGEAEKSDKAVEIYEKGIKKYPENWELRYNFGDLYSKIEKNEKAQSQFEKASELASDSDIMAHYQLYQGFRNIGDEDKAEKEMNKIIEIQQSMNQNMEKNSSETEMENNLDEEDLDVDTVPTE